MMEDVKVKETHRSFVERVNNDKKLMRSATSQNHKRQKSGKTDPLPDQIVTHNSSLITKEMSSKLSDHEVLEHVISKLGVFVRLLIWLKKNLTD